MRWFRLRAVRATVVTGLISLILVMILDAWYLTTTRDIERERVRERLQPYVNALRSSIDRRIGVLVGFHSFVATRRTRAALEAEFPLYASGAAAATPGVRALEYFEDGKLVRIEPLGPNRAALGMDLANDPRPQVRRDYQLALTARGPYVTGPFALAEGGMGILLRQRLPDRPGFPQVVAVVLDAPQVVRDAGIPDVNSGLLLEVLDDRSVRMGGDVIDPAAAPEMLQVVFEGERWSIRGVPVAGWQGSLRDWHLAFRLTMALVVLLAMLVAFAFGARLDRLAGEKALSGSALEVAMRAGGTGAFSIELATNRVEVSGATAAMLGADLPQRTDLLTYALDLMPPEDRRRVMQLCDEARGGVRKALATEFRLVRPDGAVRTQVCLGEVVPDVTGKPQSLVGILTDVTDRRAMEEHLRQSERLEAVGKLAGGVAHDFNNLLSAIRGFAELSISHLANVEGRSAKEMVDDLEQVLESTREGARLTTQLLAFSRRGVADISRVDVIAAVNDLQPILGRLFAGRLEVAFEPPDTLPAARAEAGLLTQVMLTLLVRARDAVPGPKGVRIRASHVPSTSGRRPLDAPVGEWIMLEVIEEGTRTSEFPSMRRRPTPSAGVELGGADGALGLAVLASGLESAGGRLVLDGVPGAGGVARIYLPPWGAGA